MKVLSSHGIVIIMRSCYVVLVPSVNNPFETLNKEALKAILKLVDDEYKTYIHT